MVLNSGIFGNTNLIRKMRTPQTPAVVKTAGMSEIPIKGFNKSAITALFALTAVTATVYPLT